MRFQLSIFLLLLVIFNEVIPVYSNWNYVDNDVDPCDDFYQHVCGKFTAHQNGAPYLIQRGDAQIAQCLKESLLNESETNSIAVQKLRQYRQKLGNNIKEQVSATRLHREINQFGSCPILNKNWNADNFYLTDSLHKIANLTGHMFLFDFDVAPLSTAEHAFKLKSKSMSEMLSLNWRDNYSQSVKDFLRSRINGLLEFICTESNVRLGKKQCSFYWNRRNGVEEFVEMLSMLQELKNQFKSSSYGNLTTFGQLSEMFPIMTIDFFKNSPLISDELRSHLSKNSSADINVYVENTPLMLKLRDLIEQSGKAKMANFLCISYMLNQFEHLKFNSTKYVQGNSILNSRQLRRKDIFDFYNLEDKLKHKFPLVSDHLFINKCVDGGNLKAVRKIANDVKEQAIDMIKTNKWLTKEDALNVKKKLESMKFYIGGSDEALQQQKLDQYYEDLIFLPADSLRKMEQKLRLFSKRKHLDLIVDRQNKIKNEPKRADEFNASYMPNLNTFVQMAGTFFHTNFNSNSSLAEQYGTVGSIIAHEIFHSLDTDGITYNANGAKQSILNKDSLQHFSKKTDCFVDQYGKLFDKKTNLYMNGLQTLDENLADNSGLKASLLAYKNRLNQTSRISKRLLQEFFYAHANYMCYDLNLATRKYMIMNDEHSLEEHRVNEAFKNMPQFSQAFNCPLKSKMNPVKKCELW